MLDDIKLRPKDQEPAKPTPTLATGAHSTAGAKPAQPGSGLEEDESAFPGPEAPAQEAALGNLQLSVDQVTRAGALVSGKVTFSDGQAAEWYLDQFGRLGLSAKTPGYRPSQADVMAFQTQLQAVLANSGF